jgi:hypothetical protein
LLILMICSARVHAYRSLVRKTLLVLIQSHLRAEDNHRQNAIAATTRARHERIHCLQTDLGYCQNEVQASRRHVARLLNENAALLREVSVLRTPTTAG